MTTDQDIRRRALERQSRRLAALEQHALLAGRAAAPDLLREIEELRLIVALLAAGVDTAPSPAAPAQRPTLPPLIVWPADGKEMVLVPGGAFVMGLDAGGRAAEQPAHECSLPDFYIDRTPVTNAEYASFVAATGHPPPRSRLSGARPLDIGNHPVVGVSWHDAHAYAVWAGKRLPSEPEWEKAAGWDAEAGVKRRYPWGDEWALYRCNTDEAGIGATSAVGAFSPQGDSPCGAVDMAGNVFEWTASLDWNYPCRPGDGRDDPLRYGVRVRRGGSFSSDRFFARTTSRFISHPDGLFLSDGFRCAADPP